MTEMPAPRPSVRLARLAVAAVIALGACRAATHADDAPAGTVMAIDGHVSARRAAATTSRTLALDAPVFADDTVSTGSSGSVQIRFAHNGARWNLGPAQSRRVLDSVAWTAAEDPKSEALLHSDEPKIGTIGAGRHGEHEGVSSSEAALRESPTPQPGQVTVMGSMDRSVVLPVVARSNPKIRACYEEGLARKPDLAGKLVVAFVVGSAGNVARADVQTSTLGDPETEACILRVFRALHFPAPQGGGEYKFSYPLRLGSKAE